MTPSRRTLAWLTGWMLGGFVVAVAVLPFVRDSWPAWVLPAVLTVFATSIAGPVLIGGWMLGRALAPAGGIVGFVFALGFLAGPAGQAASVPWVMWAGYGGLALGAIGLVLLAVRRRIAASARRSRTRRRARGAARRAERAAARERKNPRGEAAPAGEEPADESVRAPRR